MNPPPKQEPPLPSPLLHKCVEEREKKGKVSLDEPAVAEAGFVQKKLAFSESSNKFPASWRRWC
jgi:hypothetical protein